MSGLVVVADGVIRSWVMSRYGRSRYRLQVTRAPGHGRTVTGTVGYKVRSMVSRRLQGYKVRYTVGTVRRRSGPGQVDDDVPGSRPTVCQAQVSTRVVVGYGCHVRVGQ